MEMEMLYGGSYIMGTDIVFNYGLVANVPKNVHDISRCRLSYAPVATNLNNNMPKSMVDSCIGFADMLQITHLKLQQAIAKAKPDGLIIDIEGLENVQLGKGGDLQPLDLHDIGWIPKPTSKRDRQLYKKYQRAYRSIQSLPKTY
jgi:hypothetical protein